MTVAVSPAARLARLLEQEAVLRRAAEQTLLDQRLFMVSGSQYQALMDLLDQPEQPNAGLRDLFSRKASWDAATNAMVMPPPNFKKNQPLAL